MRITDVLDRIWWTGCVQLFVNCGLILWLFLDTVPLREVTWEGDRCERPSCLILPGTGNAGVHPGTPLKPGLSGVAAGRGCLSHFCSADGGALTPTPPSVTSASRVRLFPSYVGRIFLPSTACRNTEINNRGGRAPPLLTAGFCGSSPPDGRKGSLHLKFPSVQPDPPVR